VLLGKFRSGSILQSFTTGHSACASSGMNAPSTTESLKGMRILAVEDQPDLRDLLTLLLEQQGAEVIGCESAGDAFEVLVSGERLDAAVFDISMPGEDGLTLVCRWRTWESTRPDRHLPVIALTAHVAHDIERQCKAAGFDRYLSKPVSPGALFRVLRQLAPLH
jgi:two-component system OmpR family response regulator